MNFDFSPLLRYLLRRVVRIAISSGITYQAFCKLLRSVYFEVAAEFEPVNGKPNSDSRVSLLTGLPRRDVRSLRETADAPAAPRPNIERLVLDAWTSSLDFMDANGDMLPLPRTQRQGGARSFDALVERVSKDIRARSLLDEWLRKGFVALDDEDRVVLVQRRSTGVVEGAAGTGLLLSEMVSDLLNGFDQVYLHEQPLPGFGFNVVYGHQLTEESAQLICSTAQREGVQLMNRLNRLVVEREALDSRRDGATRRVMVGFGTYQADSAQDPGLMGPGAAPDTGTTPAAEAG